MKAIIQASLFLALLFVTGTQVFAQNLNVLLYHHVSDSTPASTSTTPEQFRLQLDYLARKGFNIVDLPSALSAIRNNKPLPDKAIALTFDDAFRSVYEQAFPILKSRDLPFTVFVSTGPVDKGYKDYVSWQQLREMSQASATIANHTVDHSYLVRQALTDKQWLDKAIEVIVEAQNRIKTEIGHAPKLFAYPYGEYNTQLSKWLAQQGYLAFGQQSGSISAISNWVALPRYGAAGSFASVNALKHKLSAKPLALDYSKLPDPLTTEKQPVLTVTLDTDSPAYLPHLRCYIDGQATDVTWLSDDTFQLISSAELGPGRHRYNCTAPARAGSPYYWLSQQWIIVHSLS